MNDDEFLIHCLKCYISMLNEEAAYAEQFSDAESVEVAEENRDYAKILESLLAEITGVASLNDLDDDDFEFVYECLQMYAESFVVDGREEASRLKTEEDYTRLLSILDEMEADFVYDGDEDE